MTDFPGLPPTPRELLERGGSTPRDRIDYMADTGSLPIPAPQDIEKMITGFVPSPHDVAKLGQEMVTGGITDKVVLASAIATPVILLVGTAIGGVVLIMMASKGGAP